MPNNSLPYDTLPAGSDQLHCHGGIAVKLTPEQKAKIDEDVKKFRSRTKGVFPNDVGVD